MRKTKIVALLLVVAMVASMVPSVFAEANGDCPEHGATNWAEIAEGTWTGGELADGHYKLTGDQAITSALTIAGNVCIDLAGYNITAGAKAEGGSKPGYRVFEIAAGAKLTICDSAEVDGIISGGRVRATAEDLTVAGRCAGGNIYVEGTFNLYGGVVANGVTTAGSVSYNNYGGNIYGAAGSTINIKGGTVRDGELNKGQLCYGTAKSGGGWGGNIYTAGTLNITAGTISGGRYVGNNDPVANKSTATNRLANKVYGGNIALVSGAVMKMSGGTITDGSLVNNLSTATTTPNKVHSFGGNIYANSATIEITGGTISNGRVEAGAFTSAEGGFIITEDSKHDIAARGGNIYITGADTILNITRATVSGGVAEQSADGNAGFDKATGAQTTSYGTSQGGNIFISSGTVTLKSATIADGQSDYRGGNIAIGTGSLTIENTVFQNGTLKNEYNRTVTGEIGELYKLGTAPRGADIYASGDVTIDIKGSGTKFTGANGGDYTDGQSINVRGNTVVNIYDGDLSEQSSCFDGNKPATLVSGSLRNDSHQAGEGLIIGENKFAARYNGSVYLPAKSWSEACSLASIKNGEVVLLADYEGADLVITMYGLDLFGHTLKAESFTAPFEESYVIDTKGAGKLIVTGEAILPEDNKQLPIKHEGAYVFEDVSFKQQLTIEDNKATYKFYVNSEASQTLIDDAILAGEAVSLEVKVTWTNGRGQSKSKTFVLGTDLLEQYVGNWDEKMVVLNITDLTNVTDLTCTAQITANGVTVAA